MKTTTDKNKITLRVDGQIYEGWKSARVETSIDQICRAFVLSVTDNFPGNKSFTRLKPGQLVELYVGDEKVCTGYITSTPISYDAQSVNVQIQGKSRTVDLVDCCSPWSAIAQQSSGGGQSQQTDEWADVKGKSPSTPKTKPVKASKRANLSWHNQTVEKIIADLCEPFGISVHCETTLASKHTNFTVNPGEKVVESINRLLTKDNLVVTDDEFGNLVIVEVGSAGKCFDRLKVGQNVLTGSSNWDASKIFSVYAVLGQHKGSDLEFGKQVSQDKGIAYDNRIGRYRLLVIKDTGQSSNSLNESRAEFEKNFRHADMMRSQHNVQGWRQSNGALWRPNSLVELEDPILQISGQFLINKIVLNLNQSGSITEIETISQDAYQRAGYKQPTSGASGSASAQKADEWADVKGK